MKILTLPLGALETNAYVVYEQDSRQALVIDPADEASRLLDVLQDNHLQVLAVVLTHAHFDHMLAAEALCKATGAPLWVGAGDADTIADPRRNLSGYFPGITPLTLTPDRLLQEGDTLSLGVETLTVLETPGHTPGCLCLYGDGVLLAGDTLFAGSIGRLDFPGGDAEAMKCSLTRLMSLPEDTKVLSGHGPATTIGREMRTNPYITEYKGAW